MYKFNSKPDKGWLWCALPWLLNFLICLSVGNIGAAVNATFPLFAFLFLAFSNLELKEKDET